MLKYLPKHTGGRWAIGAIPVAAIAALAFFLAPSPMPEPVPEDRPPQVDSPAAADMAETALEGPAQHTPPEMRLSLAEPREELAPQFDIRRVSDLGDVLIAGRAPPVTAVVALLDGEQVGQTVSTASGEFAMIFTVDPSPLARIVEIETRLANGDRVRSADALMLAPRSDMLAQQGLPDTVPLHSDATAPIRPVPATEPAMADAPGALPVISQPDTPEVRDALSGADTESPSSGGPLAIMMRGDGSVRVLSDPPPRPQAGNRAGIIVDSVVYDDEGDVALSGRSAGPGAVIQIYLDNDPVSRTRADADGNWQAQLAEIERGVYRLRVDELDMAAQVISRAEIPFERVTPELAREASGPQALIVQPGNTLWAMSQSRYGDGRRYMLIFDANRDQIRNPDLIFPGQVFLLPEMPD